MSLLQFLLEIFGGIFGWPISDLPRYLREIRFDRQHGSGAYESILGPKILRFLDETYGVGGWGWELQLLEIDRSQNIFRGKYDDCGGWAGIAEVVFHSTPFPPLSNNQKRTPHLASPRLTLPSPKPQLFPFLLTPLQIHIPKPLPPPFPPIVHRLSSIVYSVASTRAQAPPKSIAIRVHRSTLSPSLPSRPSVKPQPTKLRPHPIRVN